MLRRRLRVPWASGSGTCLAVRNLFYRLRSSPPLSYNLSVAREFLKQVYVAERLAPPLSPQTWSSAYTTLAQRARNPNYWREIVKTGEWARVGVYALEAYGIFKIGEILGRRSLVGYNVQ